ncbi:MAG: hypothetical protein HC866_02555 [Leptolyngbyaceae cyanobacterium RU_5_1]|nr:hypothetical protein [Leptolyngbyaceae cyanobacterium RU_5_1]
MISQNTLEMAKQGDPNAIATVLSYHLTQRYNTTASVIRLGNYLSVLIETTLAADQPLMVNLVLEIIRNLDIQLITTVEVSARHVGEQKILWSQTIELDAQPNHPDSAMNEEILSPESTAASSAAPDSPARVTATEEPLAAASSPTSPIPSPGGAAVGVSASKPATIASQPQIEEDGDDWAIALQNLLQRPEMVAVVILAILLVVWDAYLDAMGDVDATQPLSELQLARRLGISSRTLSRYKHRANFSAWSQDLDPDGIAWIYAGDVFVPKT